ncbi:hypothetical protein pb186bvf_008810 [Paramecium bursaria]
MQQIYQKNKYIIKKMSFVPLYPYDSFKMIHPLYFYIPQWITPIIPLQDYKDRQFKIVLQSKIMRTLINPISVNQFKGTQSQERKFNENDDISQVSQIIQTLERCVSFNYLINIVGSMAEEKDITIGQQNCDIQLPHIDKNIVRIHSRIITDKCFQFASRLTTPLVLFLSLRYDKNNQVSCIYYEQTKQTLNPIEFMSISYVRVSQRKNIDVQIHGLNTTERQDLIIILIIKL